MGNPNFLFLTNGNLWSTCSGCGFLRPLEIGRCCVPGAPRKTAPLSNEKGALPPAEHCLFRCAGCSARRHRCISLKPEVWFFRVTPPPKLVIPTGGTAVFAVPKRRNLSSTSDFTISADLFAAGRAG